MEQTVQFPRPAKQTIADRRLGWVVALMVVSTLVANIAAIGVILFALKVISDDGAKAANHGAFCQFLFTQDGIEASHPSLRPLAPSTKAALRSEHC